MKFGKLIALTSLICCFVLQVEAHAGLEPSEEQVVTSDSKKTCQIFHSGGCQTRWSHC